MTYKDEIKELEAKGYYWLTSNGDGTYSGHHGITKYCNLYIKDGVVYNRY